MSAPRPAQPDLLLPDQPAWHAWLLEHHHDPVGVWLRLAKKGTVHPTSLTYAQALDEALCFGWIDGQTRSCDAATMFQRFTPRRARSTWSQRNIGHIARLTEQGRMQPAGVAEVDRARADGRWDEAYRQATDELPADLVAAISAEPRAAAMVEILTQQNRFAMSFRLRAVKTAPTRERTIARFVAMLARGETLHRQKRQLPTD